MTDAPETLEVHPDLPFRARFAALFLAPGPTVRPIAEQADARRELVPLGATAGELRARGYTVSVLVPDAAVLRTAVDDAAWRASLREGPVEPELTASTGRRTGLVWSFTLRQHLDGLAARPWAFARMTAEELAEEHLSLLRGGASALNAGEHALVGEAARHLGEIEAEAEARLARVLAALPN